MVEIKLSLEDENFFAFNKLLGYELKNAEDNSYSN